jgi:hypothetical protein
MHTNAAIIGVGQSAYTRRPEPGQSTHTFIRDAVVAALRDAEIDAHEIDGMALASFSLAPDAAVDIAWKLGLSLRWLVQDTNGGCSAMNMLGTCAASAAPRRRSGRVATPPGSAATKVTQFQHRDATALRALGHGGPTVHALVTSQQMKSYGLKSDYGQLAIAQRLGRQQSICRLPRAATMEEYLPRRC